MQKMQDQFFVLFPQQSHCPPASTLPLNPESSGEDRSGFLFALLATRWEQPRLLSGHFLSCLRSRSRVTSVLTRISWLQELRKGSLDSSLISPQTNFGQATFSV